MPRRRSHNAIKVAFSRQRTRGASIVIDSASSAIDSMRAVAPLRREPTDSDLPRQYTMRYQFAGIWFEVPV